MQCPVCSHQNDPDARFCVNCGAALVLACPNCGEPVERGQKFCANCGFDLRKGTAASPASYTPDHLARRILEERHLVVGERKLVTVMFADLVGSTAAIEHTDPEEAATFLNHALGAMMDAVHEYEGTVNELRGDGIMALFGAPIAHEDHAVRACRAALDVPGLVAQATGDSVQTRVGLHTGEVLVREVGNDLSVEYQALGPTVHLAARMETLAEPGCAYITNEVRRLIEGALAYEEVGERDVKGISEPVPVYRLDTALDASPWQTRASRGLTAFTGRQDDLALVVAALDEIDEELGRVVVVVGDAGVGKSRLVHEFLASDSVDSFQVIVSEASPFDVATPYYPVKNALHAWLGLDEGSDIGSALASRLTDVAPDLAEAAPALAAVLDTGSGDDDWAARGPADRKRQTRHAIRSLVHALALQRPLVLVVEDLHWIDGETQVVLDDLVELAASSPMLMIVTHRREYEDQWASVPHVRRIHLGALDPRASMEMVDAMLGDDPTLSGLKPVIAERSEGTPLFIEEIVRALVDAGDLVGDAGNLTSATAESEFRIPNSVQAVLAARLDRLQASDKYVLQVAAVAGATAPLPLVAGVLDRPEDDVVAALERLQSREFLFEERLAPVPIYRFSHALIRDVAYNSLPMASRRELHAAMVEAIESATVHAGEPAIERLAFHAIRGGLGRRAVEYAIQAADKSIERSAYREAAAFLRDALDVLQDLPQDREIIELGIELRMRMRVTSTGATGGLKRSLDEVAEAIAMARSIGDDDRTGLLAIHYGYTANMLGDAALAEEQARVAEEFGRIRHDRYLEVEGRLLRAQSYDYSGRPNLVGPLLGGDFGYLSTEIRFATMGQTMIRSVVAGAHLAMAAAATGRFDEAVRYEDEATAIAEESGRPFDRMYMHWTSGVRMDHEGRPSASVEAHRRSVSIAEEYDLWFMTTFAQPWLGHALMTAGRLDEAIDVLRRLEAAAQRVELPFVEALTHAFAAQVMQRMDDREAAKSYAAAALSFDEIYPTPLVELVARTALGRVDGSPEARAELLRAAELAEAGGYRPWLLALLDQLGETDRAAALRSELAAGE